MKIESSYRSHIAVEQTKSDNQEIPLSYNGYESLNEWRSKRMREKILPVINCFPNTKWITIGNGNFGTDAYFIEHQGFSVLATSISDTTLKTAYQLGYIHNYKQMNAENFTEEENSFDFVFCKESFHHFPRPYIALYEMLRVAELGVVLIEPSENGRYPLWFLKRFIKRIVKKEHNLEYEKWGNFIFRVNLNEMRKILKALNYPFIAYKKFNDCHLPALDWIRFRKTYIGKYVTIIGIAIQNLLYRLFLIDYGLIVIVLFQKHLTVLEKGILHKGGFKITELPANPYLERSRQESFRYPFMFL